MIHYLAIKSISVILGLCAMIVALYVFVVDLVASISNVDPTNDYLILGLISLLIVSGIATIAAPLLIFREKFKKYYIPTSIILGIGYFISYFISRGAINTSFELLILTMALFYFLLAYLVHRFAVE